jgi:hypothetical protein
MSIDAPGANQVDTSPAPARPAPVLDLLLRATGDALKEVDVAAVGAGLPKSSRDGSSLRCAPRAAWWAAWWALSEQASWFALLEACLMAAVDRCKTHAPWRPQRPDGGDGDPSRCLSAPGHARPAAAGAAAAAAAAAAAVAVAGAACSLWGRHSTRATR